MTAAREGRSFSIREMAEETGLGEATLRMWEGRYGFPRPERLTSGHRRYRPRDVELVKQVVEERNRGLSLKTAIDRVARAGGERERSLFAAIRRARPGVTSHVLTKRSMVSMSHAIEDELSVRGDGAVLLGSFQRERHYRAVEGRWRDLARTAAYAVALADFETSRESQGGPIELRIERSSPLVREWALVCVDRRFGACLAGVERPSQHPPVDPERLFEAVWSVDPAIVHAAARLSCDLIAELAPRLSREIADQLDKAPVAAGDPYEAAAALASRMVAYVAQRPARSGNTE